MNKTISACAIALWCCLPGWAQGTLNFANVGVGVNAPVWWSASGELLEGPNWVAQLWAGPAGASIGELSPVGPATPFLTGAQAGYFTGGARTVPGLTVTAQVRVWNLIAGNTWYEAYGMMYPPVGWSKTIQVTAATAPYPPANLIGLESFWLVPEPSIGTLLIFGTMVFAFAHRKSRLRQAPTQLPLGG